MPKVSVLMPVHNEERYLKESIESVLGQTFRDFELLIFDDNSTDRSLEAIWRYATKDRRIRVTINKKNIGLTKSLNILLKKSRGKYICVLGADDIYEPNMLEVSAKALEEDGNIGGTYSDYSWMDAEGGTMREMECMEFDINLLLKTEYINLMTMMVRKECLEKVGGFDEELVMSQDSLMKLEIGYRFGFKRIPQNMVRYRIREGSITSGHEREQQEYLSLARRKFMDKHPEFKRFKVTIGVPAYNPEPEMLRKCLQSIKEQAYDNYEVIIIDDGSRNREDVESMAREFGFNYFYQENRGIAGARNAAIDHMAEDSDYLCYLSQDDMYTPEYLLAMATQAKERPGTILFSDYLLINESDNVIMEYRAPAFEHHEDMCMAMLSNAERNTMFINLSTTFIPANVIRGNRFLDELRFGEDLEWVLRTALVMKIRYEHIRAPLIKYRTHADSTTSRKMAEIPENNERILRRIREMLRW